MWLLEYKGVYRAIGVVIFDMVENVERIVLLNTSADMDLTPCI